MNKKMKALAAQKGLGTAVGASGGPGLAGGGEYNMIIDRTTGKVYHGGTVAVILWCRS